MNIVSDIESPLVFTNRYTIVDILMSPDIIPKAAQNLTRIFAICE